jgi:hypothetical protein
LDGRGNGISHESTAPGARVAIFSSVADRVAASIGSPLVARRRQPSRERLTLPHCRPGSDVNGPRSGDPPISS